MMTAGDPGDLADRLAGQHAGLAAAQPHVAAAILAASALWIEPRSRTMEAALSELAEVTGYAKEMLRRGLRHLFRSYSAPALARLGSGRREDPGRGRDPALTLVLPSGNIPGVAMHGLLCSLLAGVPCLVRMSREEPVLMAHYVRSLAAAAPGVARCVGAASWDPDDRDTTARAASRAGCVIAYGTDATLAGLPAMLPATTRFLGFGHRAGFGVIGREMLSPQRLEATAQRAAVDVAMFDQQGCMSPQWFYVERGGAAAPEEFGARLALALARLERRWPRRNLSPAEAGRIHELRGQWLVRDDARVWTPDGTAWSVILEPDALRFEGGINRTAILRPVDDAVEGLPDLSPLRDHLQTVCLGLAGGRSRPLVRRLRAEGVTRFCPLGRAQFPPVARLHEGVDLVVEIARGQHSCRSAV